MFEIVQKIKHTICSLTLPYHNIYNWIIDRWLLELYQRWILLLMLCNTFGNQANRRNVRRHILSPAALLNKIWVSVLCPIKTIMHILLLTKLYLSSFVRANVLYKDLLLCLPMWEVNKCYLTDWPEFHPEWAHFVLRENTLLLTQGDVH